MTKTVYNTELKEVKTIRIRCEHCGAVYEIPVSANMQAPTRCFSCHTAFGPGRVTAITQMMEALIVYNETKGGIIEIETEKTD